MGAISPDKMTGFAYIRSCCRDKRVGGLRIITRAWLFKQVAYDSTC